MKSSVQRTVRFESQQYIALEKMAGEQRRSIADLLRIIIDHYIEGRSFLAASESRQARVSEYAQAALDTIILEQHPEFRDRIIAETERRMERYHGAR